MTSEKTKKEKKVPIGFRIPGHIARRLDTIGVRGTVAGNILDQFTIVKELANNNRDPSDTLNTKDGSIIYGVNVGNGIHHITIKNNSEYLMAELTQQELADHIIHLVEILNNN